MHRSALGLFLIFASVPVLAQDFEIGPMVGGRFGGTLKLEQTGVPNFEAKLEDAFTYGVAGGLILDEDDCQRCDLIQFRWMRASTHLSVTQDPLAPPSSNTFRPGMTLDHFLGDFTHEWPLEESGTLRPYIIGTLGAVHMGAPASSATRFVFGIGLGLKVFPNHLWGIRLEAEYLPILLRPEVQTLVCAGGCTVVLNSGVSNQFMVSIGPAFRF